MSPSPFPMLAITGPTRKAANGNTTSNAPRTGPNGRFTQESEQFGGRRSSSRRLARRLRPGLPPSPTRPIIVVGRDVVVRFDHVVDESEARSKDDDRRQGRARARPRRERSGLDRDCGRDGARPSTRCERSGGYVFSHRSTGYESARTSSFRDWRCLAWRDLTSVAAKLRPSRERRSPPGKQNPRVSGGF
jgi:hypothetical protein